MAKRTSYEVEQAIIKSYQEGNSMKKVAQQFQTTSTTVLRILNSYNIEKRTKGGIYKIPDQEVIERYKAGESCQSIADDYKVTFHSISNILEKYDIPRNNIYYNTSLDFNYFDNIDTIDKAYFLGFLITDGSIGKDNNTVALCLSAKDKKILEVFIEKTNNANFLYERLDEKHHEFTFHVKNKHWKEALSKYGVVPQKTGKEYLPLLEDEKLMPHLLRGIIDGDGWISSASHQIGLCGNEKFITQVRDYFVKELNVYPVKVLQTQEKLWQITWASQKDIISICNFIYQDKQIGRASCSERV